MNPLRRIVTCTWIGVGTLLALCTTAPAQYTFDGLPPGGVSPRSQWEQRVLQTARAPSQLPNQTALTDYRFSPQPSIRPGGATGRAAAGQPIVPGRADTITAGPAEGVPPAQIQPLEPDPIAAEDGSVLGAYGAPGPGCAQCGQFGGPCNDDSCGQWGDDCDGGVYACRPGCGILSGLRCRDLSVFAGVHGFKGPADRGLNGNFGFQEGVNFGAPLGGFEIGYQVGFAADQSNFSGDQTLTDFTRAPDSQEGTLLTARRGTRNQYFFTGGIFRRALCGGFQWGVVFDFMREMYYDEADLKQIRSETSFVFPGGCNEIGYFGAYNVGKDRLSLEDRLHNTILLAPTDMFVGFFRRHFETGGEGRFWAGATGRGNGLVGADLRVPLGGSWGAEGSFNYLIPKQGPGSNGLREEAWGLNIQLVWYPGRRAACVQNSCYRPLFNVADNSTFMVHTPQEPTPTPQQPQTPTEPQEPPL